MVNTTEWLHANMVRHWAKEHEDFSRNKKHNLKTRFARAEGLGTSQKANGDVLLQKVEDLFFNGFGVIWSEVQCRIFHALMDSCLPRIYGAEWEYVKTRVMKQRGLDRINQETLVNMARRNGKTWVVSGAAAALLLIVPNISIAVFSVGKRQAAMFMTAAVEKIEMSFNRGTHVNRQGYNLVQKNQENIIYEHPDGGKQVLGCFPGSVKVRFYLRKVSLCWERQR